MSEEWQFCFPLKGLVAPAEGLNFGDIFIIGFPPSNEASVFFKLRITKNERDTSKDKLLGNLRNIIQVYGLVTNFRVEVPRSSGYCKITEKNHFGDKSLCKRFIVIQEFSDDERKRNTPNIKKSIEKYREIKDIFEANKRAFLRNAIDYYVRSIGDKSLEEKLLDLMISLESLFSKEKDELGLRYSLRIAYFLSVGQEKKRPDIFTNVHRLYGKRSEVVHGTENVELDSVVISTFQEYVREAIKRLLHIEMPKQEFLELLDASVYDEKKRLILNEVVGEAIKKW